MTTRQDELHSTTLLDNPQKVEVYSDELLKMGKYSILLCIFVEIAMLSQLSNTMFMVYAGSTPTIKSCGNHTFSNNEEACKNFETLCKNQEIQFDRQFYGITEQFELLCESASHEKIGTSIQMIGLMLGCLVFGQISDLFGRKWPMMICILMCFVFGVASSFSKNFEVFTILRTILCFFNGGQSTISVVYMIENVPKRSRMYISTLISYSPNVILLGVLAYVFQSWSTLAIIISLITLPAATILCFLHESPRWLMQKGRIDEATRVLEKIGKTSSGMSGGGLRELLLAEHQQFATSSSARKRHSFWDLLSNWRIAIGTFVIAFTFFSTTTINYSNMFNLGSISGSIYTNSILIGLLRYSVSISCGFLDYKLPWFNRKMSHGMCSIITISCILAILAIYLSDTVDSFGVVIRFCVLASCAMSSQSIIVASVTSNELMPTAIRSLSYSVAQLSARFGIVFAPHIFYMNLYLNNHHTTLPYIILLLLAIADFLLFRFAIPETKNKPLEDHIVVEKEEKEESH